MNVYHRCYSSDLIPFYGFHQSPSSSSSLSRSLLPSGVSTSLSDSTSIVDHGGFSVASTTGRHSQLVVSLLNSIYCSILLVALLAATCHWDLNPSNLFSSERISACWCDFNSGHLLSYRHILDNRNLSSNAVNLTAARTATLLDSVRLDHPESNMAGILRALENAVAVFSERIAEPVAGIKFRL